MDEIIYKPCKKCGAEDYDNVDDKAFDHDDTGLVVVEPNECDRCSFELVLSPSDEVH